MICVLSWLTLDEAQSISHFLHIRCGRLMFNDPLPHSLTLPHKQKSLSFWLKSNQFYLNSMPVAHNFNNDWYSNYLDGRLRRLIEFGHILGNTEYIYADYLDFDFLLCQQLGLTALFMRLFIESILLSAFNTHTHPTASLVAEKV